jgi:hypothetical protein
MVSSSKYLEIQYRSSVAYFMLISNKLKLLSYSKRMTEYTQNQENLAQLKTIKQDRFSRLQRLMLH